MTVNIKDMLEDKNGIIQRRKIHRYLGLWNDLIRSSCGWCHPRILEGQPTSSDTRRTDLLALVALAVCRNVEVLFGKDISCVLATSPSSAWASWEAPRSIRCRARAPTFWGSIR